MFASERLPVMVWIHGGGFQFGTSLDPRSNGELLGRKGVILVSLNYRLGVFGFFADPQLRVNGRLSSNFGIQDQIAALKWVKQNIANLEAMLTRSPSSASLRDRNRSVSL